MNDFPGKTTTRYIAAMFAVHAALLSGGAWAFNYDQKMIVHDNKLITQLNNCGVHQTVGKYIRGNSRVSTGVNVKEVILFDNLEDGVVSIIRGGDIYFSPNGKFLDGGGSSYKIGNVPGTILNLVGHRKNLLVHTKILSSEYIYLFDNAKSSSRIKSNFPISNITLIGAVGDYLYFQETNGTVRYTYYSNELISPNILPKATAWNSGRIKQVIPYRRGMAVLADSGIYLSTDKAQLTSGPAVTELLRNASNVAHIANKDGVSADETYTVTVDTYENLAFTKRQSQVTTVDVPGTRGLYVALNSGDTYFSPDGKNLSGGGNSFRVTRGITPELIRDHMDLYKDMLGDKAPENIDEIRAWVLNDGEKVTLGKGSNILLKNLRFVGWAQDFAGYPATVRLYDKGWDDWEYKWRDRGLYTGQLDFSTDGSELFDLGIQAKAVGGCAVVAAIKFTTPADLKLTAKVNDDGVNTTFSSDEVSISAHYGNHGAIDSVGYGGEFGSINFGVDTFSWGGIFLDGATINLQNIFNIEADCPSVVNGPVIANMSFNLSWYDFFTWAFNEVLYYHLDDSGGQQDDREFRNDNLCSIDFK